MAAITAPLDGPEQTRTTTAPTVAMFPGQGSQRAGMAAHLLESHADTTTPVFAAADEAAGFGLTELCVSGTKEQLTPTEITQLAVVATSLATWEVLRAHNFRPVAVAGHSLGEFSALVAAGVLDLASAFALVRRRGELMARVAANTEGGMLAVVGLPSATVERLCAERDGTGVAEVANYNDPNQTVVSGHTAALEQVAAAATEAGAQKVVFLEVGAAFHCSLMADIEAEFAEELAAQNFSSPRLPVISSVTGESLTDGAAARIVLRRQLSRPVRWTEVLRTAEHAGPVRFAEIGPGRVLTGFVKNTFADRPVFSTGDARRIDAAIKQITTQERNQP
ncbi:ACP S-malonyltransferase [Nocardia cyriacigeorgica]|uniref:Malonyl CoA-acyl carrier protein transacylase n=2 Tax=Nocardia cyriacigeorgica TaxID=135487 RepID=A0A6P1CTI8_9NOCA|nr:ACP S-malonyltransferase [Nocardia cyriacigeorgica]NEW34724.1 ACP S-malonyltransferase [Nocardia cyriacigeorgica]